MSIKDSIKEGEAFIREEFNEATGDKAGAQKARQDRNAAKLRQGKLPKTTPVGSGN